jgi:hypothetical protein
MLGKLYGIWSFILELIIIPGNYGSIIRRSIILIVKQRSSISKGTFQGSHLEKAIYPLKMHGMGG